MNRYPSKLAIPAGLLVLAGLVLAGRAWLSKANRQVPDTLPAIEAPGTASTEVARNELPASAETPQGTTIPTPPASPPEDARPSGYGPLVGEPTTESRELVNSLARAPMETGAQATDQAGQWKRSLQALAQQGASGVPAIQEFLRGNLDVDSGPVGQGASGYPSLRVALFDVLREIGGPEAEAVVEEALRRTAHPREVALLARALETMAPETHRTEILAATRDCLAMAAEGQLDGLDVAPLFEVLAKYGGTDAVEDLEQAANRWKYYAAATLGRLPDGAGVPSLVRMVSESGAPDLAALETLAGMSGRNADARRALLDTVGSGRIRPNAWAYLSRGLTGDEVLMAESVFDDVPSRTVGQRVQATHISYGNQNLLNLSTLDTMTPEELNVRVALVDAMLGIAGSEQPALDALRWSRSVLASRLEYGGGGESEVQRSR